MEWEYLWAVMGKFDFGEGFLSWVKLLYCSPQAAIREAGHISAPFTLHRGTQQGCPLSPLLFAIAIEPMAALIRANQGLCSFQYREIREKFMLYADDAMVLLGDTSDTLRVAMAIICEFVNYLGPTINWTKSTAAGCKSGQRRADDTNYTSIKWH